MITSTRALLNQHWIAILFALCTAILVSVPTIAFPFIAAEKYEGINIPRFGNDEHSYLTRAKEYLERGSLGNPYIAEGKDVIQSSYSFAEALIVSPFRLLGMQNHVDVPTLYAVLDFICVAILVLLIYAFMLELGCGRAISIAAAFFVIAGYSIVYNKALFYTDYNVYARMPFPVLTGITLFAFLICTYRALLGKHRIYPYLATGLLSLAFYEYFYAWTFMLAFCGSLFLVALFVREWKASMVIVAIGAAGVVIGAPVLLPILYTAGSGSHQLFYFNGANHGRVPVMSLVGLLTAALFCVYTYWNRRDPAAPLIASIIAAGWIALNQQLITGMYIQYGHYYWYFVVPLAIVIGIYMVQKLLPPYTHVWLAATLIVLATLNATVGQYRSMQADMADKLHEQHYAPTIAYLKQAPYGVVLGASTGDPYPYLVTIYTNDDLYWAFGAMMYTFPMERVRESLFVYLYLNHDSRKDPEGFLKQALVEQKPSYAEIYKRIEGYESGLDFDDHEKRQRTADPTILALRASLIPELGSQYRAMFPSKNAVIELLKKRGVSYILWDKAVNPEWDLSFLPITQVAGSDDVILYALKY